MMKIFSFIVQLLSAILLWMVGGADECDDVMNATPHLYAGGHRSVIMSVQNGRVLTLLVKLMRGGREKVCLSVCLSV